ncbi:glycoside hydrolase family 6 protein [Saccharothrix longispora]|uniref:Glucanase n=1 Tax=Saccharothrix longispora TaxID=33920 RepID=A0ABU1PNA8_9PSEU|nr:glycoside hydrolase family 6 protein [Saccharothrix longispora]MDR6591936.1 cellulose 1,4-beta-cellobiosidase [Saccharothrix longispora]
MTPLARLAAALVTLAAALVWSPPAQAVGRVDNPYAGARPYVDPQWSARAAAEPGGGAVAGEPTAVWLDGVASVHGGHGRMGLRDHLDEALRQGADLVQLVLRNAPGRDCGWLSTNGELAADELPRYRAEFVDPIVDVLADPAYAGLRVVVVVEPNSLPFLVTHVLPEADATPRCEEVKANGAYVGAVGYALARLGAIGTTYSYLDIGHHGSLGWSYYREPFTALLLKAANTAGSTTADVHGFVANTANYSVLREEHITKSTIAGQPILQSRWVDWNPFIDELSYADAVRRHLVAAGFRAGAGVVVDTSRNGWGGPSRPTGPGWELNVDTYVDGGRLDRRLRIGNWCNQVGAGLGEPPTASPAPDVDAYAWLKPPGVSDGASIPIPTGDENFNRMCDPTYTGWPDSTPGPTGARPDSPPAGQWDAGQFRDLLRNAHPPR